MMRKQNKIINKLEKFRTWTSNQYRKWNLQLEQLKELTNISLNNKIEQIEGIIEGYNLIRENLCNRNIFSEFIKWINTEYRTWKNFYDKLSPLDDQTLHTKGIIQAFIEIKNQLIELKLVKKTHTIKYNEKK